jgi:hypothetical protein
MYSVFQAHRRWQLSIFPTPLCPWANSLPAIEAVTLHSRYRWLVASHVDIQQQ